MTPQSLGSWASETLSLLSEVGSPRATSPRGIDEIIKANLIYEGATKTTDSYGFELEPFKLFNSLDKAKASEQPADKETGILAVPKRCCVRFPFLDDSSSDGEGLSSKADNLSSAEDEPFGEEEPYEFVHAFDGSLARTRQWVLCLEESSLPGESIPTIEGDKPFDLYRIPRKPLPKESPLNKSESLTRTRGPNRKRSSTSAVHRGVNAIEDSGGSARRTKITFEKLLAPNLLADDAQMVKSRSKFRKYTQWLPVPPFSPKNKFREEPSDKQPKRIVNKRSRTT